MFNKIKSEIRTLSQKAVFILEKELSGVDGEVKKQKAIEYIISNLSVNTIYKNLISIILSKFIDKTIEKSVQYLKYVQTQNRSE